MRSPEDIRTDDALRNVVLPLIEKAPVGELRARLLKELRRGYDSNTSQRHKVLKFKRAAIEWARAHIVECSLEGCNSVLANDAYTLFRDEYPSLDGGKRNTFFAALREAGFPVTGGRGTYDQGASRIIVGYTYEPNPL